MRMNISITGGEFSTDVSAFVADGYIQHEGVVVPLTVENAVAQVGEKYYATLGLRLRRFLRITPRQLLHF